VLLALAIIGLFVLPAPWGVIAVFTAAVIEVGEVFFWIRFLRRYPVTTGAEGLLGERGEVIVRCAPRGRVALALFALLDLPFRRRCSAARHPAISETAPRTR
jgi:membrane protein implicated in regulation of membrane protease activity